MLSLPNNAKRVVITGFGLVTPIGMDAESVWAHLSQGKSGIAPLQNLPTDALPFKSGGEAREFTGAIDQYGPLDKASQRAIKKNLKVMCREIEMSVAASQKALHHCGIGQERDSERCGCLFGCDYILTRPEEYADGFRNCREQAGGEFQLSDWPKHGLAKVNPLWLLKYLPNMPNSHVSIYNDFRGPNNAITMREASMNLAMSEATSIIQRGAADLMLVGATGSRIHPLRTPHVALIDRLAQECEEPGEMCRPFDQSCDGMVVGEGASAIVLESLQAAEARGAKIWGEVVGYGSAMGPADQAGMERAITQALQATVASASELPDAWHMHAQGTSWTKFDQAEASAIAKVLGGKDVPVTAAQSYFGNLGAGGAGVGLISSLLALEHNSLFPIRNLKTPIAEATWRAAAADDAPGSAFVHSSFTLQGQASALAIRAL